MNNEHPLLTLYRIEMLANNINEMLTRYAEATAFALDEKEKELLLRVKNSLDSAFHNAKFFALLAGAGVGLYGRRAISRRNRLPFYHKVVL